MKKNKEYTEGLEMKAIHRWVCESFKADPLLIKTRKDRHNDVIKPRQTAQVIADSATNLSLHKIGGYYNKDHATVLNSIKSIQGYLLSRDEQVVNAIEYVSEKIGDNNLLNRIQNRKFNYGN